MTLHAQVHGYITAVKLNPLELVLLFGCLAGRLPADSAAITIPSVAGAITIDGRPDEPGWQGARVLSLTTSEFGAPFSAGGEARMARCGKYLCLSARLPEPDRVVAHSAGHNPSWWPEDVIRWNIRVGNATNHRALI